MRPFSEIAGAFLLTLLVLDPQQQTTEQQLRELRDTVSTRIDAILASLTPGAVEPTGLQAAINSAPPGTTLYLRRGGVYPAVSVRSKDDIRITSQGAPAPSPGRITQAESETLAVFEPTGNLPAVEILGGRRIRVDNLWVRGRVDTHINCGVADSRQTSPDQQPTDVTFERLYMDGSAGAKRGIGLHCRNATIRQSYIRGYCIGGQDTQTIGGWNGEGPYTIEDNYLEACGENVMFGGAAPPIAGMVPRNIGVLRNAFYKDPTWKGGRDPRNGAEWTVKNHFELKVAEHVRFVGNRVENQWAAGQHYAVMLTPQAQDAPNPNCIVADVTIEDNTFVNVSGGIVIKGREQLGTPCLQGSGFVVRRNTIPVNKSFNGGAAQGWVVYISGGPRDVSIEQNFLDTNGNQVLFHDGAPVFGFRLVGNLVPRTGAYGITVNGGQHRGAGLAIAFPGGVLTGSAFGRVLATATTPSTGIIPSNMPGNLHMETAAMLPLIDADGYGTDVLAPYGRPRQ